MVLPLWKCADNLFTEMNAASVIEQGQMLFAIGVEYFLDNRERDGRIQDQQIDHTGGRYRHKRDLGKQVKRMPEDGE